MIWVGSSKKRGRTLYVYAGTIRSAWQPGKDAAWIELKDLPTIPLCEPDLRPGLLVWRDWTSEKAEDRPLPWSDPDWYEKTFEWADDALRSTGATRTGAFQQLTSRPRDTLFRCGTTDGPVYLKAVTEMFHHEPTLSAWLSQRHPRRRRHRSVLQWQPTLLSGRCVWHAATGTDRRSGRVAARPR